MPPEPSPVMADGHDRVSPWGTIGTFAGIHICYLLAKAAVHALTRDYGAPCRSAPCFSDPFPVFFLGFVLSLLVELPPTLAMTVVVHRLSSGSFRLPKRMLLVRAVALCAVGAGAWSLIGQLGSTA